MMSSVQCPEWSGPQSAQPTRQHSSACCARAACWCSVLRATNAVTAHPLHIMRHSRCVPTANMVRGYSKHSACTQQTWCEAAAQCEAAANIVQGYSGIVPPAGSCREHCWRSCSILSWSRYPIKRVPSQLMAITTNATTTFTWQATIVAGSACYLSTSADVPNSATSEPSSL